MQINSVFSTIFVLQLLALLESRQLSNALLDFLTSFEDADSDLRWIESTAIELRLKKEESHFGYADGWYRKFQLKECEVSKLDLYCSTDVPSQKRNSLYDEAEFEPLSKFEQESNSTPQRKPDLVLNFRTARKKRENLPVSRIMKDFEGKAKTVTVQRPSKIVIEKDPREKVLENGINLAEELVKPHKAKDSEARTQRRSSLEGSSVEDKLIRLVDKTHARLQNKPELAKALPSKELTVNLLSHSTSKHSKKYESNVNDIALKVDGLVKSVVSRGRCLTLEPHLQKYLEELTSVDPEEHRISRNVKTDELSSKYLLLETLLEQFRGLSVEEQHRLADVQEILMQHLSLLDEIETALKGTGSRTHRPHPSRRSGTTAEFERLASAVEFIRRHHRDREQ